MLCRCFVTQTDAYSLPPMSSSVSSILVLNWITFLLHLPVLNICKISIIVSVLLNHCCTNSFTKFVSTENGTGEAREGCTQGPKTGGNIWGISYRRRTGRGRVFSHRESVDRQGQELRSPGWYHNSSRRSGMVSQRQIQEARRSAGLICTDGPAPHPPPAALMFRCANNPLTAVLPDCGGYNKYLEKVSFYLHADPIFLWSQVWL